MDGARLRLRLRFDDPGILSKSQRKDGLKRSWLLLQPHHQTISDVVSYLLHHFDLYDACPNGIILSMDGFVLPPFESTAMLKDGDLIRVKRKETRLRDFPKAIERGRNFLEDVVVDKQALPSGLEFSANEYHKITEGYESKIGVDDGDGGKIVLPLDNACNGDVTTRKRKASNRNENPKAKRKRPNTAETVQKKHGLCEPIRTPQEKGNLENGSKQDSLCDPKVNAKCTTNLEPNSNSNGCFEPDANAERATTASGSPDGLKKVSRNTRRKRLQRQWKREHRGKDQIDKLCEKELPVHNLNADSMSKKDVCTNVTEQQQRDEDSNAEGDLVPVVIRPGHIRFTPSGKVNDVPHIQETNVSNGPSAQKSSLDVHSTQKGIWKGQGSGTNGSSVCKNQVAKETSQWNAMTRKRKGQKWGVEKQPASSWKASRAYKAYSSGSWTGRKQVPGVDFEKLVPLIDLPKAGDIVAYRLLELSSSSRCPQLSSFRIGKISWFEPDSNRIMLVLDPDYPLNIGKKGSHDGASGLHPESSMYNEDGSLEIDFPSLVDVRIVKHGDLSQSVGTGIPTANVTPGPSGTKMVNETQDGSKNVQSDVRNWEMHTPAPVNAKRDVWEEISEALLAKKAQLTQEDSWNRKKPSSSNRTWSQRTLRGNALSHTMAMPRAQNAA